MCRSCAAGGRRCPGEQRYTARAAHNGRRRAARTMQKLASSGVRAVRARDAEPQYWWDGGTGAVLTPARSDSIRDPVHPPFMPSGGLWTSPALSSEDADTSLNEGFHTAWSDFHTELHGTRIRGRLTPIKPSYAAVTVQLATEEDFEAACRRWPHTLATGLGQIRGCSFEAMRRDGVACVQVQTGPLTDIRGPLYGWDVDSAVWLNPACITPGHSVRVDATPRSDDI